MNMELFSTGPIIYLLIGMLGWGLLVLPYWFRSGRYGWVAASTLVQMTVFGGLIYIWVPAEPLLEVALLSGQTTGTLVVGGWLIGSLQTYHFKRHAGRMVGHAIHLKLPGSFSGDISRHVNVPKNPRIIDHKV